MVKAFVVYTIRTDSGMQDIVSILPHEHVFKSGLCTSAIVGTLRTPLASGGAVDTENVVENPAFVDFLHNFLARRVPYVKNLRETAKAQASGFIYVIDMRTPTPDGNVPPEDIIGALSVQNGAIVENSYRGNDKNHQILSEHGFFRLEPELMEQLVEDLKNLTSP